MDFPVSIWTKPTPSEDVAFEAVPDVLTKSIPGHLFLAAFLDLQSAISLCQVNRSWRLKNVCDSTNPNPLVITIYMRNISDANPTTYEEYKKWLRMKAKFPMKKFPSLQSFTYTNPRNDPTIEQIIKYIPCLRELALSNSNLLGIGIRVNFSDADMPKLIALSALQKLNIYDVDITDIGVANLSHLTGLQELTLRFCNEITDVGVSHLRGLSNLHSLDLGCCEKVTDIGLSHLSNLVNLQNLNCKHLYNTTEIGLSHLSTLTRLTTLILHGCLNVTNNGFNYLNSSIQTLDLFNCDLITDDGVERLSTFTPRLRNLNLHNCGLITDTSLSHLGKIITMQCLILQKCDQITDAGLSHLSTLTALQGLNISWCPNITDVGLTYLSNIHSLELLSFRGTKVKSITPKEMSSHMYRHVQAQIRKSSRLIG